MSTIALKNNLIIKQFGILDKIEQGLFYYFIKQARQQQNQTTKQEIADELESMGFYFGGRNYINFFTILEKLMKNSIQFIDDKDILMLNIFESFHIKENHISWTFTNIFMQQFSNSKQNFSFFEIDWSTDLSKYTGKLQKLYLFLLSQKYQKNFEIKTDFFYQFLDILEYSNSNKGVRIKTFFKKLQQDEKVGGFEWKPVYTTGKAIIKYKISWLETPPKKKVVSK